MDIQSQEGTPGLELAARVIPLPGSISAEAQAALTMRLKNWQDYPAIDDHASWRAQVVEFDAWYKSFCDQLPPPPARVERLTIADAQVAHAVPDRRLFPDGKIILDLHGGAMLYMGGEHVTRSAADMAARTGAEIFSVDYRMPPDHPYPAGLDDCVRVYGNLVERFKAENIIVCGLSAGGNLAAALMIRAQEEGLPQPKALVLLTPELDMTESGDTFQVLYGIDRLTPLMPVNLLYANGTALDDPKVSPLFADLSNGFPPTFLQSGTRDLFLSNVVRMHRRLRQANIEAELHVWEAMTHGGFSPFGLTPEDQERDEEVRRFLGKHWQDR